MPFCRECGKEVQDDWVTCPYCSAPTGVPSSQGSFINNSPSNPIQNTPIQESSNKSVWYVIVVCITVAILMWPHGILGITMIDRATANCESLDDEWIDLGDECTEWKDEGQVHILMVIGVALFFLAVIAQPKEKAPLVEEEKPTKKPYQQEKHSVKLMKKEVRNSSVNFVPPVEGEDELEDEFEKLRFGIILSILTLLFVLQFIPLFDTISSDGLQKSEEKSSMYYLMTCEVLVQPDGSWSFDWEPAERYCTSNAKSQVQAIELILIIVALSGIHYTNKIKKFLKESDEEEESEEEESEEESNHSPLDSNH
jgi:hypothetical protein